MAHDGMMAGYVSVDAYIEQGEQQRLRRKCVSPDALLFSNA